MRPWCRSVSYAANRSFRNQDKATFVTSFKVDIAGKLYHSTLCACCFVGFQDGNYSGFAPDLRNHKEVDGDGVEFAQQILRLFGPQCFRKSGGMLSGPSALPVVSCFNAVVAPFKLDENLGRSVDNFFLLFTSFCVEIYA